MNTEQLKNVVARIQAGDNRVVDTVTLAHWQQTIGELDYEDTIAAVVTHFKESTAYLLPAHVIANYRRIRVERGLRTPVEVMPAGSGAPAPKNLDALTAAHGNPEEFEREWQIYEQQLRDEGYAA